MAIEKAMIIDIDNTLIDSRCQAQYFPQDLTSREQWDEFQTHTGEYSPNPFIEEFILDKILYGGVYPIFVTSREKRGNIEEVTKQCIESTIGNVDYKLYMREENDYRTDAEVKSELLDKIANELVPISRIEFAIDDKTEICELWQSKGIKTLQFRFGG